MILLDTIIMDDVIQIFFEHTNRGSHLANLRRQRLASVLDEACKGTPHDYIVPSNVVFRIL